MDDEYIHSVTIGGTIDTDDDTRRRTRNLTVGDPAVERILAAVAPEPTFDYGVDSVLKKGSLDTERRRQAEDTRGLPRRPR